jgi:hypothetical protein
MIRRALTGSTRREDLAKWIVDSMADLCNPDQLVHDVLPTRNCEDDTPHDIRDRVAAHS